MLAGGDPERVNVVAQRWRMVRAPGFNQAAEGDRHVDQRRQGRPGQGHGVAQPAHHARQPQRDAGVALPGDGGVAAAAEPAPLRPERGQCEGKQNERQHGGSTLVVLRADDGEEDRGREHIEIAAQHQWVAEVGEALDKAEQEGVGEAGPHQRQGYGGERGPGVGPQSEEGPRQLAAAGDARVGGDPCR